MRLPLAAAAVTTLLSLLTASSLAQVAAASSAIKVTVVDQSGAVIPGSELVFRGDSRPIVARTDDDGAVTVSLQSGRYAITTSHLGFLKNEMPDFQVAPAHPGELRIVLNVGPSMVCTLPCGPMVNAEVPTIPSDVLGMIPPDPEPPTKPAAKMSRSWHCLYFWKCAST
jgi:Carboxypeptidase regulatory-like domain